MYSDSWTSYGIKFLLGHPKNNLNTLCITARLLTTARVTISTRASTVSADINVSKICISTLYRKSRGKPRTINRIIKKKTVVLGATYHKPPVEFKDLCFRRQ